MQTNEVGVEIIGTANVTDGKAYGYSPGLILHNYDTCAILLVNFTNGNSKTKISTIQTEYGYLYLKRTVNTVGVYGAFENLPLNTEQIEITKDFKDFNPNYSYAVVDVKSGAGPFDTVGSLWLYPNGQTMQLYKPANLSRAYITGNYVIQA